MTYCNEEWTPGVGFEGLYEVSNLGLVRGISPVTRKPKKPLNPFDPHSSYHRIRLWKDRKIAVRKAIHQIVIEAFVGPRPPGMVVNHLNGKTRDNRAANLEYVTQRENCHHAIRLGLNPVGISNRRWSEALRRNGIDEAVLAFALAFAASSINVPLSNIDPFAVDHR